MQAPSAPTIEVTLRSLDGLDDFAERKFTLTPNTPVPIGRSSKNTTKKLMSGPDNAFIDSPVISREHALISASAATGLPAIFIKDNGSMHGTFVNSHPLERNKEYMLHSGDELRFGMNVVRDHDSFIAKKYSFQSQIKSSISRGFSVPDVDTEEEEDMEIDEDPTFTPVRYGSQTNPVNLDDFEDVPQQVFNLDEEDPAADKEEGKPLSNANALMEDGQSEVDEEHLDGYDGAGETQNQSFGLLSDSLAAAEEEDSEDDADHTSVGSDDEDEASNSSHGSMSNDNSDAETDSGSEEDADAGAARRSEHEKAVDDEQVPQPSARPTISTPYTVQATPKYQEMFHSGPDINFGDNVCEMSSKELEQATHVGQTSMFTGTNSSSAWEPLYPRPTAPKPSMWGPPVQDASSTYAREHNVNPWFEPSHNTMGFSYSAPDPRPMKMDYLGQVLNSEPMPALGMPTPPMPAADDVNPMNAQANPRTKVSISEIVEETQQDPPSPPQSVASPAPKSLKRKAEVLEAEEKEMTKVCSTPAIQNDIVKAMVQVPQAAVVEPPAKRHRGTFAAAARATATFVAGGLFAVGCLVMSPDSAFK